MPRNLLMKRRTIQDSSAIATLDHHTAKLANSSFNLHSHLQSNRPTTDSDEELPSPMSDDSCDSGRDSAVPGEMSHCTSFDGRPSHLSLPGIGVSSSSSSDSLMMKSPVSPVYHPMGHISLLPGILESLAVSGSHHHHQREITLQLSATSTQVRQLAQPPCYAKAALQSTEQGPLTTAQLQSVDSSSATGFASSFPSPASRKRSNSITNVGENGPNAYATTTQSARPIPKQRKVKKSQEAHEKEMTTSPVSGTIIRGVSEGSNEKDVIVIRRGDLDKSLNVVEMTEEAKAGLAEIANKIGAYTCKLCKLTFGDAFGLAGHNCSRIIHIEYQCPECGKSFHCPANLASHRRWHKPRPATAAKSPKLVETAPPTGGTGNSCPAEAKLESPDLPQTEENSFFQKIERKNIPFKKRFLFRKKEEKEKFSSVAPEAPTSPSLRQSTMLELLAKRNGESSGNDAILLQEFQEHQCQMCSAVVRGTQLFARHWQNCLLARAANRNWTSLFYQSKPN